MRAVAPRSSHASFEPSPDRIDPVEVLEQQAQSRAPELVPVRYGRMLVSPFAFYRGAAQIMAADLATTSQTGLHVQLCGDAHLSNFGVFASPERRLVFDLNDFDETLPGPWEWDVKRLAASVAVAGRENGFSRPARESILLQTVRQFRDTMREFASMRTLDVWYAHIDVDETIQRYGASLDAKRLRDAQRGMAKARTRDNLQALRKLTTTSGDGRPRFRSDPPLIVPLDELAPAQQEAVQEVVRAILRSYRRSLAADRRHLLDRFHLVDLAHKVVGVGSVGTRAWVALFLGRDDEDPLLLQVKEAQQSVLEPYVGRSRYANNGQRVVAGQFLLQSASDIFLGWHRTEGIDGVSRDFYVRQLRDWKSSADIDAMTPGGMVLYAKLCAWTLARAHARSGDAVAIGAYLGKGDAFDRAIASFAESYADQNERDYEALVRAVRSGRVSAQTGL